MTKGTTPKHIEAIHAAAVSAPVSRDGRRPIELKVRTISALFNSLDPAPFREKDLDAAAEAFIVGWAEEYPTGTPISLRIHVQEAPNEDATLLVRDAVHNYFAYRGGIVKMELRRLMKQGRVSLLIGIAFLSTCLLVKAYLLPEPGGPVTEVLRDSLATIRRATDDLGGYLRRKAREVRETEAALRDTGDLNHRQLLLVSRALKHPLDDFTIAGHRKSHGIAYDTARRDLLELVARGWFTQLKRSKQLVFRPADDLPRRARR